MKYLTIKETALRWGVSERTVNALCTAGRVEGAYKFGSSWAIPHNAEKPIDPRKAKKLKSKTEDIINEEQLPSIRYAMPFLNTPFKLGNARQAIESIKDLDTRNIAIAEYYYFCGQSEKAAKLAEDYLHHNDLALQVSACWIYAYANLSLDRISKVKQAMSIIGNMVKAINDSTSLQDKALLTCCSTGASVLLHLPLPKILSPLKTYIHMMPPGLRLFVLYIEAHHAYLNRQYGVAIGIAETALALESELYPIPTIYLHLVASMGYINMNHTKEAKEHLEEAWKIAQPDDLIEPLGEHQALLCGGLEATIKRDYPNDFKRIIDITNKFSVGWRKVHNMETGNNVADNLTTTEFAAAMLAARGWTNQEIATHMGISEYTVRHYLAITFQKLNINQRKELQSFLLK